MWSNIALVLVGALVFTLSLKGYGGDLYLQDLARHIDQPFLLLALVLALFFVLGFFLEFVELTALLIPVFGPVLFASQIDPVWIGVLIGLAVQTSFLTPPMGLSLFYFQAALKKPNHRDGGKCVGDLSRCCTLCLYPIDRSYHDVCLTLGDVRRLIHRRHRETLLSKCAG